MPTSIVSSAEEVFSICKDVYPKSLYEIARWVHNATTKKISLVLQTRTGLFETLSQDSITGFPNGASLCQLAHLSERTYIEVTSTSQGHKAQLLGRLPGGMFAELVLPAVIPIVIEKGMKLGAAFISGAGDKESTNVKVQIEVDNLVFTGRYTGEMTKIKKEGQFFDKWAPFGDGKITFCNGDRYEGSWVNGQFNSGTYETADGTCKYEGHWKDGERVGYGKLFTLNSKGQLALRYEGEWKDSKYNGKGTLFGPDGSETFGIWEDGKFIEEKKTEQLEELTLTISTPEMVEAVLEGFNVTIPDEIEAAITASQPGLVLNDLIAQGLGSAGALFSVPLLGIGGNSPTLTIQSFDTERSMPMVITQNASNIDLGRLILPKMVVSKNGKEKDALAWLKSYASTFEVPKEGKETLSKVTSFKESTEFKVPHQIIAVGLPFDPTKGNRAEFAPFIQRDVCLSEEGETTGFIAWLNNGAKLAFDCEHGNTGSFKVMSCETNGTEKKRRAWGMQSVSMRSMAEAQIACLRKNIDTSLSNAMHIVYFRFLEAPKEKDRGTETSECSKVCCTGVMTEGKYTENDTRGMYNASVYRELDPKSIQLITIIGMPISISAAGMSAEQIQYCIKSHIDRMGELLNLGHNIV